MGTQLPSPEAAQPPPIFGPYLLWPNGCMDQNATWFGARRQPRGLCVRWGPSPPKFSTMFIIDIVIFLEHCTVVIDKFKYSMHSVFTKKV